jgi:hypothetical protein
VQYKTSLFQANWSNFGSASFATNGTMSASNSTESDRRRFYSVVLLP